MKTKTIIHRFGKTNSILFFSIISVVVAIVLELLIALILKHELSKPYDFISISIIIVVIVTFYIAVIYNLTVDVANLEKENTKLATYDKLTGLFNRPIFNKACEKSHSYCMRNKQSYCILVIKLNDFNQINEKYSLAGGDRVLEVFGQVIQETVRDSDISTHLGGENFALFLPNTDTNQAKTFIERLKVQVKHKAVIHNGTNYIKYTTSIGLAENPHNKNMSFEKIFSIANEGCIINQNHNQQQSEEKRR